MALPTVKSTYALDPETVRKLARLADAWKVSKSEALRRLIRQAPATPIDPVKEALRALDEMQQEAKKAEVNFDAWAEEVCEERQYPPKAIGRCGNR